MTHLSPELLKWFACSLKMIFDSQKHSHKLFLCETNTSHKNN